MDRTLARQRLLHRSERLQKRLDRIRSDRRRSADPLSPDFADQAIQRENDETLDFLDMRTRAEIAEIEAAIERLAAVGYGVCEQCGESISELRMEVLPAALTCSSCASSRRGHAGAL